jgi:hypothetical protein
MNQPASPGQVRMSLIRWALFIIPAIVILGFLYTYLNTPPDTMRVTDNEKCPAIEKKKAMAAVDGDWDVTIKSPMGDQKSVFTVTSNGGSFSGKVVGTLGSMDVKDGSVDGNSLTWKMDMTEPMKMTIEGTATVDGDTISGQVKAGDFGLLPLNGCRKA